MSFKSSDKCCCVCGRTNTSFTQTKIGVLCQKHSHQFYKYGKITDPTPYSCQENTNEYVEHEDYYEIVLRKCTEEYRIVGSAKIDKDDYERCKLHRWRMAESKRRNHMYKEVATGSKSKGNMIDLHRFIMSAPEGYVVDHINGDTLDNRKSNLRVCKQEQNCYNKTKLDGRNTSGITGVYVDTRKGRSTNWVAEIKVAKTKIYLSAFVTIEEAVYCRYYAEQLLFGEFRPTTNDDVISEYIKDLSEEDKLQIEKKVKSRISAKLNNK